jgi:hypothetical protein
VNIGKAHIILKAEGCIDCGAAYSLPWEQARVIEVVIEGETLRLALLRCSDCAAKAAPGLGTDAEDEG